MRYVIFMMMVLEIASGMAKNSQTGTVGLAESTKNENRDDSNKKMKTVSGAKESIFKRFLNVVKSAFNKKKYTRKQNKEPQRKVEHNYMPDPVQTTENDEKIVEALLADAQQDITTNKETQSKSEEMHETTQTVTAIEKEKGDFYTCNLLQIDDEPAIQIIDEDKSCDEKGFLNSIYHFVKSDNKVKVVKYDENAEYNFDRSNEKYFETKKLLFNFISCNCPLNKDEIIDISDDDGYGSECETEHMKYSDAGDCINDLNNKEKLTTEKNAQSESICDKCNKSVTTSAYTSRFVFVNNKADIKADTSKRIVLKTMIKIPKYVKLFLELSTLIKSLYEREAKEALERQVDKNKRIQNPVVEGQTSSKRWEDEGILSSLDFELLNKPEINEYITFLYQNNSNNAYTEFKVQLMLNAEQQKFFDCVLSLYTEENKLLLKTVVEIAKKLSVTVAMLESLTCCLVAQISKSFWEVNATLVN